MRGIWIPLPNLERLVERRQLNRHQPTRREVENHLRVAREFLHAASLRGVPDSVRFSNLYDAAHAVALSGLKLAGYRAPDGEGNRQFEGKGKKDQGEHCPARASAHGSAEPRSAQSATASTAGPIAKPCAAIHASL